MLTTITELPEYIRRANELLSEAERKAVIDYLAAHPLDGDIMEGTGGIRKLRWASGGKGKSGGVRIIYYSHLSDKPYTFANAESLGHQRIQLF